MKSMLVLGCALAFCASLYVAPTEQGRIVSLDEASQVSGAGCSSMAVTNTQYCSFVCGGYWPISCTYLNCAACGCPTVPNAGGPTAANVTSVPCGAAGCGSKPSWTTGVTCNGTGT